MNSIKKLFTINFIFLVSLFLFSCTTLKNNEQCEELNKKPKYIFLFIGDGMGLNHVNLAKYYYKEKGEDINFTNFPTFGISTTSSKNSVITDSGAAGSAIACGEKTNSGNISYYPWFSQDSIPISFAKIAHDNNMKVGIITSVAINHATPAAFYAQSPHRDLYYEIGYQLPESGFDFFGGGGFKNNIGKENDKDDLYERAKTYNYTISSDFNEFTNLVDAKGKYMFVNSVLGWESDMPYAIDRQPQSGNTLAQVVEIGIKVLNNPNGFFMMVEGGKIDWAAHSNDGATIVKEIYDLDLAIREALKFYEKYPDETLILVTADHETGGLSLGNAHKAYDTDFKLLGTQKISSYKFSQIITDYKKKNKTYNIEDIWKLSEKYFINSSIIYNSIDSIKIKNAFEFYFYEKTPSTVLEPKILYGSENPIASTFVHILNEKAGIGFTSWSHTAAPVPVYSIGLGSKKFNRIIDNTEIKEILLEILNWE